MKIHLLIAALLTFHCRQSNGAAAKPPNIVFFLADDLGQRDLGCYGSAFYETPSLDRRAKDGAWFTDAYAACPVCSPTRSSLLTGQWLQRTGVTDYIGAPTTPAQDHAVYAGMVEAVDLAVGKVLAKLDELGLRENTLVIFTSDNGGLSKSEGWPTSNLPLRGGKGWMYEGGIREPLLVRWPAVVKPGSVVNTPVSSPDLSPTLLKSVGAKPQPGQALDGTSLMPLNSFQNVCHEANCRRSGQKN